MSRMKPDTLSRLRAANPARVEDDRGRGVVAQAALERILRDTGDVTAPGRAARRRRSPRGVVLVFAAMAIGVSGAVAATDPFGWWSANANEAKFAVNTAIHVHTPSAQLIRCRLSATGGLRCTAQKLACASTVAGRMSCATTGTGQAYNKLAAITAPASTSLFSRASFHAHIKHDVIAGTLTASHAAQLRAHLANVPDSFFTELRLASRFNTIGTGSSNARGQELVPPPGIPEIIVCQDAGPALNCRNLNGDENAPVGAGVYGAQAGPGWRVAPPNGQDTGLPPGIHFTAAEFRVLIDLGRFATVTHSSSSGHATRVPTITPRRATLRRATR